MIYATEFGPPSHVTKILQAENGKKLTNLNRYISVITGIDQKRFAIFEHTINHLFSGYVRLPQLEYYLFFVLHLFSYFFSFFFFFFRFLLLNGLTHCIQSLSD